MTDPKPWAPPAPIGPHVTAEGVTEWQQLAWTMLADDAAVDLTTVTEDASWQHDAERKFGDAAAVQIRAYDALMTIRFGPETSQAPTASSAGLGDMPAAQVDTAEAFARTVQHLTTTHDNDWELRDEAILALALEYAGQFLPARCVVQPPLGHETGGGEPRYGPVPAVTGIQRLPAIQRGTPPNRTNQCRKLTTSTPARE